MGRNQGVSIGFAMTAVLAGDANQLRSGMLVQKMDLALTNHCRSLKPAARRRRARSGAGAVASTLRLKRRSKWQHKSRCEDTGKDPGGEDEKKHG
jgi:hypothetical protein